MQFILFYSWWKQAEYEFVVEWKEKFQNEYQLMNTSLRD